MIIIFVAIVLVLGTGKLPGTAKKMGKIMSEYYKAKNEIQQHQMVYASLKGKMGKELHALALITEEK